MATVSDPVIAEPEADGPLLDPAPLPEPADPVTPVQPVDPGPTLPQVVVPAAPVVTQVDHDPAYLPVLTGTALPGAEVGVRTLAGEPVGTTTADEDGLWTVIARLDSALAGQDLTLEAVQTVDGISSDPTAPLGPFSTEGPILLDPADGDVLVLTDVDGDGEQDDISVRFDGVSGLRVEAAVDGVATGNLHQLTGTPLTRMVRDLAPGEHTFAVRYADAATGRAGAWTLVTFTVAADGQLPDPASGSEPGGVDDPPGSAPVPVDPPPAA
ncbi:Ig-like domain-containing protein [Cellulomonas denverensis]|uniref:Ig-like domain-containing protein n=1 Tax=Cellulomonas denverensis TaxID=264297 RepID=UPI0035E91338